jgi:uncharacterized caspase-like protein
MKRSSLSHTTTNSIRPAIEGSKLLLIGCSLLFANAMTSVGEEPDTLKGLDLPEANEGPSKPGERWALLIGIEGYLRMPQLNYCVDDMVALRNVLLDHCGYAENHVRMICDGAGLNDGESLNSWPSQGTIKFHLRDFLKRPKPEDTVLVAFSGHGKLDDGDRTYLVPIDSSAHPDEGVLVSTVYELLESCPARRKVLVLDCCHSGGKRDDAPATRIEPDKLPNGRGIVSFLSCDRDESSHEDPKLQQGVFSFYLVQALRGPADREHEGNNDGLVTAHEAYSYVHKNVTEHVEAIGQKQTPKRRLHEGVGRIVLASVRDEGQLRPARIIELLEEQRKEGRVSEGLVSLARAVPRIRKVAPDVHSVLQSLLAKIARREFTEQGLRPILNIYRVEIAAAIGRTKQTSALETYLSSRLADGLSIGNRPSTSAP